MSYFIVTWAYAYNQTSYKYTVKADSSKKYTGHPCTVYTRYNVQGHKQENKSLSCVTQEDPGVSKSVVSGIFWVTATSELRLGRET